MERKYVLSYRNIVKSFRKVKVCKGVSARVSRGFRRVSKGFPLIVQKDRPRESMVFTTWGPYRPGFPVQPNTPIIILIPKDTQSAS